MLFFLDIDGVMVPAKGWKSPEFSKDGFPAFSDKATRVLQSVISEKDTVVLTTSHRSKFSIEEWKNIFKSRGINVDHIVSLSQNLNNLNRKDEILNWFSNNNVNDNFVIIDDDTSLNELPDYLKQNLIQPAPFVGLTEEHLEMIKSVLHKTLQPA